MDYVSREYLTNDYFKELVPEDDQGKEKKELKRFIWMNIEKIEKIRNRVIDPNDSLYRGPYFSGKEILIIVLNTLLEEKNKIGGPWRGKTNVISQIISEINEKTRATETDTYRREEEK